MKDASSAPQAEAEKKSETPVDPIAVLLSGMFRQIQLLDNLGARNKFFLQGPFVDSSCPRFLLLPPRIFVSMQ